MSISSPIFSFGTFSVAGSPPFPGLILDEQVISLNNLKKFGQDFQLTLTGSDNMLSFIENWKDNLAAISAIWTTLQGNSIQAIEQRKSLIPLSILKVHAPLLPRQIFCAGANYYKHVVNYIVDQGPGGTPGTDGMNLEQLLSFAQNLMTERAKYGSPYMFSKIPSSVTGPYDPVILPKITKQADWELELAVVISKPARNIALADAMNYVAGYTIANDISARDLIFCKDPKAMGTDFISGKNSPTFLPLGPYIVPAEFIPDPYSLQLTLKLNGEIMQNENTSDMIFNIARQIEYISSRVQLWPGDVICTGSPAGNGMQYQRYLHDGDVMDASITSLGAQRNACINE
ncbi:MAG: fumarylacetoacetate hydrolase family protein [Pseudomonadota bacterium]